MPTLKLPRRETLHLGVALSKAILKRAIRFTEAHSGKCETYAGPLHKLSHHKAVGVFWGLFASIIVALLIATYYYAKAQKEADLTKEARQNTDKVSARKHRSIQKQCLIVTLFCFVTGFLFLLFGAFAALNVQWCQGEDLIQFYWGFWILIGIGSEFAMLGIVVHQISALCGHESPPWNVALGTPVLVFAGVSFLWVAVTRKWAGTRIIPRRLRRGNFEDDVPMEDMPTPGQGTYQITRTDQGHLLSLSGMPVGASLAIRAEDNGFIIECNDIPPPMQETTPQPSTPSARSNATTFAVNNVSESLPANGSAIKSPDEMHQQSSEREQLQNDSESQSREAEQADGAEST